MSLINNGVLVTGVQQSDSVQLLSRVWLFATPWTTAHQASLSITNLMDSPCPSRRWCHPTISSSVVPFSSCPQSFPASGSFQTSQLFASGGQSIRISSLASVLPMNTQDWSPLGWRSLQSKGLSRVFSNTTVQTQILRRSAFFTVQLSHPYVTTGKTTALTRRTFVDKVIHLYPYKYSFFFKSFSHLGYCRMLSRVPCDTQ